jgi:hypothetical protein
MAPELYHVILGQVKGLAKDPTQRSGLTQHAVLRYTNSTDTDKEPQDVLPR